MIKRILQLAVCVCAVPVMAVAQDGAYGAYTPYSIFGVGELSSGASAYARSMGGVGIASRNVRFLNLANPAAVTARDSLSFMVDFSLYSDNTIHSQGKAKSVSNAANMGSMAISFPAGPKVAVMMGISPYSNVGYDFSTSAILADEGQVTYTASGQGGLYKIFTGAGMTFGRNWSAGVEVDYLFGNIERFYVQSFASSGMNAANISTSMVLHSFTGKLGVQYLHRLDNRTRLIFGSTLSLGSRFGGSIEYREKATGSASDMSLEKAEIDPSKAGIAPEFGIGIGFARSDRFRAEIDYLFSNWKGTGLDSVTGFEVNDATLPFSTGVRNSIRAGLEFVPNRNDIRYYYKKITYRAGAYYNDGYFTVGGNKVAQRGITLGATLPVFRWYNGLTVAVDFGKTGSSRPEGMVQEKYVKFTIGVNLFDIWFQQQRYD